MMRSKKYIVVKQKFWKANKKVSNKKIKKKFCYTFLFPSYLSGLKQIIRIC